MSAAFVEMGTGHCYWWIPVCHTVTFRNHQEWDRYSTINTSSKIKLHPCVFKATLSNIDVSAIIDCKMHKEFKIWGIIITFFL